MMPGTDTEDLTLTAIHEAGHAIAAMLLTGDVADVTICADGTGYTEHVDLISRVLPTNIDEPRLVRCLNSAVIAAAGPLAVAMAAAGTEYQPAAGPNDGDYRNIDMAWEAARDEWEGTRETFVDSAYGQARSLLQANWNRVEAVATALIQNRKLDGTQLLDVVIRESGD